MLLFADNFNAYSKKNTTFANNVFMAMCVHIPSIDVLQQGCQTLTNETETVGLI